MPRRRIVRPGAPQVVDVLTPREPPVIEPVKMMPRALENMRPVPESDLTPDQKRIRQLEDALAKERGRKDPEPELEVPQRPGDTGNIVIHFLEDGFTALGHVWYRGQELEFAPDGAALQDTRDRTGRSWVDLRDDEFAQAERWGKVMFRTGPWPGRDYTAATGFERLRPLRDSAVAPVPPTEAELVAAAKAERNRRRAVPRLPAA